MPISVADAADIHRAYELAAEAWDGADPPVSRAVGAAACAQMLALIAMAAKPEVRRQVADILAHLAGELAAGHLTMATLASEVN